MTDKHHYILFCKLFFRTRLNILFFSRLQAENNLVNIGRLQEYKVHYIETTADYMCHHDFDGVEVIQEPDYTEAIKSEMTDIIPSRNVVSIVHCFLTSLPVQREEQFPYGLLKNLSLYCTYKFSVHKIILFSKSQPRVYS